MADWKQAVSANASTVTLRDITNYISSCSVYKSPIDEFYTDRNQLLTAITPAYAAASPAVMPLILVGLISLTENYFRGVLAGALCLCPMAKEKSANKTLNLATAWFGYGELEKGAFENTSFSDADTVRKNFTNLLAYNITPSSQISTPLNEFDRLCELRHAIVHSAGLLAGKNAVKLQLSNSRNSVKVTVGFAELQEAADICTALVCAVNLEIFVHLSKRWHNDWPRTPAYRGHDLNKLFKRIWDLFHSTIDSANNVSIGMTTQVKARNLIIRTRAN